MRAWVTALTVLSLESCQRLPSAPDDSQELAHLAAQSAETAVSRLQAPQFLLTWGHLGAGPGEFNSPQAVAVSRDGNVYVADAGNKRIQQFTSSGTFIRAWNTLYDIDQPFGGFGYPRALAVDNHGRVYVAVGNFNIQVFASDGAFLRQWRSVSTLSNAFYPRCIALDGRGHLYAISEGTTFHIKEFSEEGTFLREWGREGTDPGQFTIPRGIAVGRSGDIYVSDLWTRRMQEFTPDGALVRDWGGPTYWGPGFLLGPLGVATDSRGNVYVVDAFGDVKVFSASGDFLMKFAQPGIGEGQLNTPEGIAIDPHGFIYIADLVNHRIQKFSPMAQSGPPPAEEALSQSEVDR